MKRTMKFLGLGFVFLGLYSCSGGGSSSNKNTVSNTNPVNTTPPTTYTPPAGYTPPPTYTPPAGSGNCSYGTGNEQGLVTAGQTIDYYKINNPPIVAHGAGDGAIVWSSETDLPGSYNQNIFYTNAKFNLRVIPRRQYYGTDSKGVSCAYQPRPYTKLQVGVVVRRREDPPGVGAYYLFDNVNLDCASQVHEFSVPTNTAFPLVVEVKNVKWDWSCQSYINQGFTESYLQSIGYCPFDNVWLTECYSLEVQFATDTTKDIPGQRTY